MADSAQSPANASARPMTEQRLFEALATITRAFGEGRLGEADPQAPGSGAAPPASSVASPEAQEVLGEAGLAVAFGAFASRGGDGGAIQVLIAALGLMAILAGDEPDPPAEILGIAAEDARVEAEIDRAGDALDREFGREATSEAITSALEARILGSAITLAGCTLPEGVDVQAAVRLRAARALVRLAAGLMAMNAAGGPSQGAPSSEGSRVVL
ncbi:MAG TPA: hypothetical protein VGN83_19950 [Falsiroseomonas sp.]|jgi:hypothetical protein|nr:hypothetical protein [Falsiroseomonas sp.]